MAAEKKVYDYNKDKVRDRLVGAFRSRRGEATVADIAALTGLPLPQIEAEMPAVSDEYGARLKVSESGELLYSFPRGMKSRYKGFSYTAARFWKTAKKALVAAGKAAFKVWIMATLVGYFMLFIALALFAMVASVAVQSGGASRDSRSSSRRDGGGLGGLWLTTRLFDTIIRIWFYSELFKSPEQRYRQAEARKTRRPLHKAVFSHVFGDGDPNPLWAETEKKAVLAFLQTHKGLISLPEFMAISGLAPAQAHDAINRYMLEFEGRPEVTEGGTVYFFFPKLLARAGESSVQGASTNLLKRMGAFSSNQPKADTTFRLINLVNVVFGSYYLYNVATVGANIIVHTARGPALRGGFAYLYSMTQYLFSTVLGLGNPTAFIGWVLGVIPLVFSACFFLIPIIRSMRLARDNEAIKTENLRRSVYRSILIAPEGFRPEALSGQSEEASPRDPAACAKLTRELALLTGAALDEEAGGAEVWNFSELAREERDIARLRETIDLARYAPGKTVFDTQS